MQREKQNPIGSDSEFGTRIPRRLFGVFPVSPVGAGFSGSSSTCSKSVRSKRNPRGRVVGGRRSTIILSSSLRLKRNGKRFPKVSDNTSTRRRTAFSPLTQNDRTRAELTCAAPSETRLPFDPSRRSTLSFSRHVPTANSERAKRRGGVDLKFAAFPGERRPEPRGPCRLTACFSPHSCVRGRLDVIYYHCAGRVTLSGAHVVYPSCINSRILLYRI